eukprot:PhF_6_TR38901/c0_g1_i1/m.58189
MNKTQLLQHLGIPFVVQPGQKNFLRIQEFSQGHERGYQVLFHRHWLSVVIHRKLGLFVCGKTLNALTIADCIEVIAILEKSTHGKPLEAAMGTDAVTATHLMRCGALDDIIVIGQMFQFHVQTLLLAMTILDRYESARGPGSPSYTKLVSVVCLLIAAKVEEVWPITVSDCVQLVHPYPCSLVDIIDLERKICILLSFRVALPVQYRRTCVSQDSNVLLWYVIASLFVKGQDVFEGRRIPVCELLCTAQCWSREWMEIGDGLPRGGALDTLRSFLIGEEIRRYVLFDQFTECVEKCTTGDGARPSRSMSTVPGVVAVLGEEDSDHDTEMEEDESVIVVESTKKKRKLVR